MVDFSVGHCTGHLLVCDLLRTFTEFGGACKPGFWRSSGKASALSQARESPLGTDASLIGSGRSSWLELRTSGRNEFAACHLALIYGLQQRYANVVGANLSLWMRRHEPSPCMTRAQRLIDAAHADLDSCSLFPLLPPWPVGLHSRHRHSRTHYPRRSPTCLPPLADGTSRPTSAGQPRGASAAAQTAGGPR